MKLQQTGNVGSHNIAKSDKNPKDGYPTYDDAKTAMETFREEGCWEFSKSGYGFTVIFYPSCAVFAILLQCVINYTKGIKQPF